MGNNVQKQTKGPTPARRGEFGRYQQVGKRVLAFLYLLMLMFCIVTGLWPTIGWVSWLYPWAGGNLFSLALVIGLGVPIFGLGYLAGLLFLRLLVPRPREGFFSPSRGRKAMRGIAFFMLNILLTRLRFEVPWASSLLHTLTMLPVIHPIYRRLFCPHMGAFTMGDTNVMTDPYLMHIHPTVQLATGGRFGCHLFDQRGLLVKRIVIGEHTLIGPEVVIGPGVHVGDHSIIQPRAVLAPNTRVPPYEYWGGAPACKISDLGRPDEGEPGGTAAKKAGA